MKAALYQLRLTTLSSLLLRRLGIATRLPYYLYCLRGSALIQHNSKLLVNVGGVDGTRTRDPRRDRPVF